MEHASVKRGFTLIELLVVISIIALLIGILLPAIGKARNSALVLISMSNLRNFGAAHATYASEWNGRQLTMCPDDLSLIIGGQYSGDYNNNEKIPPVPLGFDRYGEHHSTTKGWAIQQSWWTSSCGIGNHRVFHFKPFNQYINGRVYDPIFWAPKDFTVDEKITQWYEDPGEWPVGQGHNGDNTPLTYVMSTYSTSTAASVNSSVFRGEQDGGSQSALSLPAGHRAPNLSAAVYPDLKTHMLEHRWLQNPPSRTIPGSHGTPWYFNMGADSSPAVLFYDSSVRMRSTREAVASSNRVVEQGEDELDACDPGCYGCSGHYEWDVYGGDQSTINSWHVFTRDGIMGRDFTE